MFLSVFVFACACMHACVCACMRACVCVRTRVCVHAPMRMRKESAFIVQCYVSVSITFEELLRKVR